MAETRLPKIADTIADHIEKFILEGVLRPGEKLASERELSEKLDVSRPTLRTAIAQLVDRGLLITEKNGTYVSEFLSPLMAPLISLLSEKPRVTDDYLEFRRCVEAEASALAAIRATDVDRKAISQCVERMKKTHKLKDPTDEAEMDIDLHLMIYEASHNVVLLHIMRAMGELLRADIFYNRQRLYLHEGVRDILLNQHIAIAEAVIDGKAKEARKAASEHIHFTVAKIAEIRNDTQRLESSLDRIGRNDFLAKKQ